MAFPTPPITPYARLWTQVLEPAYHLLRGRDTSRIINKIEESQWWSRELLDNWQWSELAKLLIWAKERVPFYRQWFSENPISVKDFISARDITILPLISRSMLNSEPEIFKAQPLPPGSYAKSTGGTSGQPLHFMLDAKSDQWRNAVTQRGYTWAGASPGNRQLHVWSVDLVPPPLLALLKRELHRKLMRLKYLSGVAISSNGEADEILRQIDLFKPEAIVTYPSTGEVYSRRAMETGWIPQRPPFGIITGAETVYDYQRELMEAALRSKVFETYGSREFMLIACECQAHQGMHIVEENLMVEVINAGKPAAPGELGEVLITDLHNYAMPFIRYSIGDVSSWLDEGKTCACGRSLRRLGKVEGRVADVFRSKDGRMLSGLFFPHLLKDFKVIERFQIVQDRLDHLIIRLKLNGPLAEQDSQLIISKFQEYLPGVIPELVEVDEVEISPTGKVRAFIGLGDSDGQ